MQPSASSSASEAIQAAATFAESFIKDYYRTQDLPPKQRSTAITRFYHSTARISWNGNPIPSSDLSAFAERLPFSFHEVQSWDCQPIAATASIGPPSMILSVTGQVTHGTSPPPTSNPHIKDYDFLPRVFSQSLVFVWDPTQDQALPRDPQYLIQADTLRFV